MFILYLFFGQTKQEMIRSLDFSNKIVVSVLIDVEEEISKIEEVTINIYFNIDLPKCYVTFKGCFAIRVWKKED